MDGQQPFSLGHTAEGCAVRGEGSAVTDKGSGGILIHAENGHVVFNGTGAQQGAPMQPLVRAFGPAGGHI